MENNINLDNYEEVDSLTYDNSEYVLLVNKLDDKDIIVRKIVTKDNNSYAEMLSEVEFDKIIYKFIEKNKDLFE